MAVGATLRAERPRRRGPADDKLPILEGVGEEDEEDEEQQQQQRAPVQGEDGPGGRPPSKEVAFAFLPDHYQPLGWGGEEAQGAERKSKRRRRKLKRYGKNMGKALRKGCHFLVLGLQSLANAYSSPFGVAVSVVTAFR